MMDGDMAMSISPACLRARQDTREQNLVNCSKKSEKSIRGVVMKMMMTTGLAHHFGVQQSSVDQCEPTRIRCRGKTRPLTIPRDQVPLNSRRLEDIPNILNILNSWKEVTSEMWFLIGICI